MDEPGAVPTALALADHLVRGIDMGEGTNYAEFLRAKVRAEGDYGRDVAPDDLHPSLFPFQRDITRWALRKGRAAVFADTGLGKTRMQIEWARLTGERALILAPLTVARQTVREAALLGVEVTYARSQADATDITITNYEMLDHFDPGQFGAVVLDESSILKNVAGKTRTQLIDVFKDTPWRLACTATPAPNDVAELCNHSEFLGVLPRVEMLASFFVHDDEGWRLKGHASESMYEWMSSWALAVRRPSDLGYDDEAFALPPLTITPSVVRVEVESPDQLFRTELGGVGGRAQVRRSTLDARVKAAVELAGPDEDQWIIWCGLNDEAARAADMIGDEAVNVEGSWSPEAKAEAMESFQDGAIRVLVTKPSIAGFGMNFQNCARMAFVGLSDSYESYYQCIRRCWRFGQTSPVDVHIVISEIEQQIVENVRRKEAESMTTTDALVRYSKAALV